MQHQKNIQRVHIMEELEILDFMFVRTLSSKRFFYLPFRKNDCDLIANSLKMGADYPIIGNNN